MSVENQATSAVGRRKPQIVRDTLDDLEELRRGPHAADELPRLLEALASQPALLNISSELCGRARLIR